MTHTATLRTAAPPTAPGLALRPWRPADVPALVAIGRDPDLLRWTNTPVSDEAQAAEWVRTQNRGRESGERFAFAVLEGLAPVGHVVLKIAGPRAEVGYWTVPRARGKGVAGRALEAVTTWAFDAGLTRLELLHQVDNAASCRVAERGGYAYDRTLPAAPPAYPHDGHLHVRRPSA
ncbi:hypothetical protein SRB5_46140 [Streptomyces sp. RB5]|uniref:N-acetyltransferase domain-containing protein n=1 Tax=Streptomyces smaragdinus TaxID=2585196 RepID=A0A7K0CLT9_9ACTN|nr:GNAT family N-acetyltransferase [Streptomyces smaragdinus]MQY14447.1 hypothetical protein [Streptomyces smaragdinus]